MRKSMVEKLADLKRKRQEPQQLTFDEMLLLLLDPRSRAKRQANPTQLAFITSPDTSYLYHAYMGPKGCAKTSTICAAGWVRALTQPGSKGFFARADYNDLKTTTRLRAQEMLDRLPKGILLDRSKDPPENWVVQSIPILSPEGDILDDSPSQISFLGLNSLEEGGSYEFDWGAIDEASETEKRSVLAAGGWMRNVFPWAEKLWGDEARQMMSSRYRIMLAFNPTDTFHYLYEACMGQDHTGRTTAKPYMKLFLPQARENQRNLPEQYYERMEASMPEDMRMRLVQGLWGATFEGAPVVREFKYDLHTVSKLITRYDRFGPLYRFWDFGYRHPVCIWAQEDLEGRLLHFKEEFGEDIEITQFVDKCLAVQQRLFPNHREVYDIGDPAARQRKDTGSTITALTKKGIILRYRTGRLIEDGLNSVRSLMNKLIDGEPALLYDRENCAIIINAWRGGYHRDETGQKPVKDGYYDHSADADRYGIDYLYGSNASHHDVSRLPTSVEYVPHLDNYRS